MAITPKNDTDIKVDKISEKTAVAGISLDDQVICDEEIQHKDQAAPGNPADGVSVFSEGEVLKALTASGTTVQLGLLPVKNDFVTSTANISKAGSGFVSSGLTTTLTFEADDLVFVYTQFWVSNATVNALVQSRILFNAVAQQETVITQRGVASSSGNDDILTAIALVAAPTPGANTIDLEWAAQAGSTAHSNERSMWTLVFKSGGAA